MTVTPAAGPAYKKTENYLRRSPVTESSKSSFDQPRADASVRHQVGITQQYSGRFAASYKESLQTFESLADVLATFDAAKSANANTKDPLHQAVEGFKHQFANAARDKNAFDSLMQTAFGDKFDKQAAQNIRRQTLNGDFSWMPGIEVVNSSELTDTSGTQAGQTGLGAYHAASDTIYLSEALLAGDPGKAIETLTEEVGHAIDARVNAFDSAGDEGELFAKLVAGEALSAAQIQAARSENDHGTIHIDGKTIEVEFLSLRIPNPLKIVKKNIIDPIVENVFEPIVDNVVRPVADKVIKPVVNTMVEAVEAVGGVIKKRVNKIGHYLSDRINHIGGKLTDGLDFVNEKLVSPFLNAIPVVGPWLDERLAQPGFTLLDTAVNLATNFVDSGVDFATHGLTGAIDIAQNLLVGDLRGAWDSVVDTVQTLGKDMAGAVIESFTMALKGVGGALNQLLNMADYRGLRPEEQAYLQTIYGDSLDYDKIRIQTGGGVEGMLGFDAHAIGNDIFIPERYFNATDGSLTEEGMDLLAHEAGHVWQFQTDGAGYISDAIISYSQSHMVYGHRNGAYDFTTAIEEMKPWNELTPDQQAEIAMVIGEAYEKGRNAQGDNELTEVSLENAIDDHNGDERARIELSANQIEYLRNIHKILLAG